MKHEVIKSRRLRMLKINPATFQSLVVAGNIFHVECGVPASAKLIASNISTDDCHWVMLFEDESFNTVESGEKIPEIYVMYAQIDS
jgi:hypothetical protein